MTDNTYEMPNWVKTMTNVPLRVGLMANAWAKLEHSMVPLMEKLLRTADPKVAKIIVFASNPVARRDLLSALTEISPLNDDQKSKIHEFLKEYGRLRVIRNDVVHGHWASLSEDGSEMLVRLTKSRQELSEKQVQRSVAFLTQSTNAIEQLCSEAYNLSWMLVGLWPSTGTPHGPHAPR